MISIKDLPDQLRLEIKKEDLERFLHELIDSKKGSPSQAQSDYSAKPKEILSVDEVAELTGLARQTIYSKVSKREIPHYKAKRKVYFKRTEILEWMLKDKRDAQSEVEIQAAQFIEQQKAKRAKK